MAEYNIVAFIFRFINAGVLIGLITYLLHAKVASLIRKKIQDRDRAEQEKKYSYTLLLEKQATFERSLEHQMQEMNYLLQQVRSWQKNVLSEHERKQREYEAFQKRIQESRVFQLKQYKQEQAHAILIDNVIERVRNTMQKKYAHDQNQEEYMQRVLDTIAKSEQ